MTAFVITDVIGESSAPEDQPPLTVFVTDAAGETTSPFQLFDEFSAARFLSHVLANPLPWFKAIELLSKGIAPPDAQCYIFAVLAARDALER